MEINIEALPVKIKYVAEVPSKWGDKKRTVDLWHVTITSKSGFHTFDYMTGLGLRKKPDRKPKPWESFLPSTPQKPTIADVLHSLVLDASAADYNFDDWCDNYGGSNDSIAALNTYKACLETATALRKHFGRDTLEAIRNHVQDM